MQVSDIMTARVVSVSPTDTVEVARQTLRSHRIHHLLVIDRGNVVGALSSRDLAGSPDGRLVSEVMSSDVTPVDSSAPLRSAAALMIGRTTGCLPVVADGKLAGIVTTTDLLRQISAANKPR
jgi:acetoin utilization protein AcuB